jgi:hypothetical protein
MVSDCLPQSFTQQSSAMQPTEFSKCECHHCQGHIEFPVAAGGETIACPHCGQPTGLPVAVKAGGNFWRNLLIVWAALVVVTVVIVEMRTPKKSTMGSAPEKMIPPATNAPAAPLPDELTTNGFGVSAFKLEKTPGSSLVYVTGTVRNLDAKQRFGVKIVFELLATNQTSVGSASDYAATLEANGRWKFKALVMESKAAAARLNSIGEDQN